MVHSSVAFFSYELGNCVINSSVTFNLVLVSSALTGASLNVFHLKSKPKKSVNVNTSYRACILKPSENIYGWIMELTRGGQLRNHYLAVFAL